MGRIIRNIGEAQQRLASRKPPEIAKWDPRGKRKCGPEDLCEGIWAMLSDCAAEPAGAIKAVGHIGAGGEGEPTAIGFHTSSGPAKGKLLMWNYCCACGEPLPLPENKAWPVLLGSN